MSDDEEQQTSSNAHHSRELNNRRLTSIRLKLQELTREKTKYNVEKLMQDADFVQSELVHLSHAIAELNKEINTQIAMKKTLNTKIAILRSNSSLRYTHSKMALRDKQLYEKELEKPNKNERYRDLARQKIQSICDALPQLEKQDEYNQSLKQAEDIQVLAQNKREKLQETLNAKSRKQTEIRQLLNDGTTRLPKLETGIENLRLERQQILDSLNEKKSCPPSLTIPEKSFYSPVPSSHSLERETLEHEQQQSNEQLEKIRVLLKYFYEKSAEHHVTIHEPTNEEQVTSTPTIDEKETSSVKPARTEQSSEDASEKFYEYKKELPTDIVDKYAGMNAKKQQNLQTKRNRKNKKHGGLKHPSQVVSLYNDVRTSTGNLDTLPYMPLFEHELSSTIKSLELLEQSIQFYLAELSQRQSSYATEENQSQLLDDDEDEDVRDSALDTFSETSSLVEPVHFSKESRSLVPQLMNIPEARSSSSSDEKKTIASSASPPSSHHSQAKTDQPFTVDAALVISPLTAQIAQIERQISDEGYRSVRNEQQATTTNSHPSAYDSAEKVDKWLLTTVAPTLISSENPHFQATDDDDHEEHPMETVLPVSNH